MNAISPPVPLIPETAPFSPSQRAWLNGFLSGLYGGATSAGASSNSMSTPTPSPAPEDFPSEDFPWHDPAMELPERMTLAEGRPLAQKLMAAMGQLDCGQCGYLCQTYADALAEGREASPSLCVPGAKATTRMVKQLLAEAPAPVAPVATASGPAKPIGRDVRVLSAAPLIAPGSSKDVRHVVIQLGESGLIYEPGDSIGLITRNDPALVQACLTALGATGDEMVTGPDGVERSLRETFTAAADIARPLDRTTDLLAMSAKHPRQAASLRLLSEGADGAEPAGADLLDLLEAFPSRHVPGWPTSSHRSPRYARGCIPSPRRLARRRERCICASPSCAMNGVDVFETAWRAGFWPIVPSMPTMCRLTSRPATFAFPPIRRSP